MAASFRSFTSLDYAVRTNSVYTPPSGLADNDILILHQCLGAGSPPTPTPPSGFTLLSNFPFTVSDGVFNVAHRIWFKVANSESGNYTVTHASAAATGTLTAIQGGDTTATPTTTVNNGTGTTSTALSITPSAVDSLILFWDQFWQLSTGLTAPTGTTPTFTERYDSAASVLYLATGSYSSASATGNKTQTNANGPANPWGAGLVCVEAAVAAGGGILRQMMHHHGG